MEIRQKNLELLSSDRFRSWHPSIVTRILCDVTVTSSSFNRAKNGHANLFYVE